jgi:chaperonin GroES
MSTKIQPLGDRVLVQVDRAEDKSKGGIIIPDAAKERPTRGKVLDVGPGRWVDTYSNGGQKNQPIAVKPNDVILFNLYAGQKVGEDLLLLHESDLLAIEVQE